MAGARAIHTDRQGHGARACASDRGWGLSAPPFPLTLSFFLQQWDDEDGMAPREAAFLQLSRAGAGRNEETEKIHTGILHSVATARALRLSTLIKLSLRLSLHLAALHRGPPGRSYSLAVLIS